MNIIIITQHDPFYLKYFFKTFQTELKNESCIKVKGLVIQKSLGQDSIFKVAKRALDLYGLQWFMILGIRYAFERILNFVAVYIFKGRFPGSYSIKHIGLKFKWRLINNSDVNHPDFIKILEKDEIDLIVSVDGSQKFRKQVLKYPKFGCINIHNSRLPKNRGMLPSFWALLNYENDPETAISIFKMDKDWDSGPIISQKKVRLNPEESLHSLIKRMKKLGAIEMVKVIKDYQFGEPQLFPNDSKQANYNSFPSKKDVQLFRKKKLRVI